MYHLKEDMSTLLNRSSKLKLKVNKLSKSCQSQKKGNFFEYSSKYLEKKGSNWAQIMFS